MKDAIEGPMMRVPFESTWRYRAAAEVDRHTKIAAVTKKKMPTLEASL